MTFLVTLKLTCIDDSITLKNVESLLEEQWDQTAASAEGDTIVILNVEEKR